MHRLSLLSHHLSAHPVASPPSQSCHPLSDENSDTCITDLYIADGATAWSEAGFVVEFYDRSELSEAMPKAWKESKSKLALVIVGSIRVHLLDMPSQSGLLGWSLLGVPSQAPTELLQGIPSYPATCPLIETDVSLVQHQNTSFRIGELVIFTPDLSTAIKSLSLAGLPRKSSGCCSDEPDCAGPPQPLPGGILAMTYFFAGDIRLLIVGPKEVGIVAKDPAWLIGNGTNTELTCWLHVVSDIDAIKHLLGEVVDEIRPLRSQPKRRYTSLTRSRIAGLTGTHSFWSDLPGVPLF